VCPNSNQFDAPAKKIRLSWKTPEPNAEHFIMMDGDHYTTNIPTMSPVS